MRRTGIAFMAGLAFAVIVYALSVSCDYNNATKTMEDPVSQDFYYIEVIKHANNLQYTVWHQVGLGHPAVPIGISVVSWDDALGIATEHAKRPLMIPLKPMATKARNRG